MVTRRFLGQKIVIILFLFTASGCATLKLSNLESGSVASLQDDETRLLNRSKEMVELVDHSDLVYNEPVLDDFLKGIILRLKPDFNESTGVHIDVKVLKDPDLNAFSLASGRIYIHSGILSAANNEDQVASILAHEMTHILHRHIVKKFRSFNNTVALWDTIGLATGGLGIIVSELSKATTVSGFSQELETEADEFGFQLLSKSGYDTSESAKMFLALEEYLTDEQEKQPFFFSSHPNIKRRIMNYNRLINEHPTNTHHESTVSYKDLICKLRKLNIKLSLQRGFYHSTERQVKRCLEMYPKDEDFLVLKGDLYKDRQDVPKGSKCRDKNQDYATAVEAYDRALSLKPLLSMALRGKAKALYAKGDKDQAKLFFKKYLEVQPDAQDKTFIQRLIQ